MEVQTRSETGELFYYDSLLAALMAAKDDLRIWKVSFHAQDGTRVRLMRTELGWVYEDIMTEERYI